MSDFYKNLINKPVAQSSSRTRLDPNRFAGKPEETEEPEEGFFSKYVKPVGTTAMNVAFGLGDVAQTGMLYAGSKIGEALGGRQIMSGEQAVSNLKSAVQPWKENTRKTFSTAINEDTNLPGYIKAPLGLAAEIGLDPLTYLGGGFGAGAKISKMSKAADLAKYVGKSGIVDKAKMAADIAKWQKYTKPISYLDKLGVAGVTAKGVSDLAEGNITQGAFELGLGGLGMSGMKSQNKMFKDIDAYKTGYLDNLKDTDFRSVTDFTRTPASTIKGAEQLMLPAPGYRPDWTMKEPTPFKIPTPENLMLTEGRRPPNFTVQDTYNYKKPAFELMDEKIKGDTFDFDVEKYIDKNKFDKELDKLKKTRHDFHAGSIKSGSFNKEDFTKSLRAMNALKKKTGVEFTDIKDVKVDYYKKLKTGIKARGDKFNKNYYFKNDKLTKAGTNLTDRTIEKVNNSIEDYMIKIEKEFDIYQIAPSGKRRMARENLKTLTHDSTGKYKDSEEALRAIHGLSPVKPTTKKPIKVNDTKLLSAPSPDWTKVDQPKPNIHKKPAFEIADEKLRANYLPSEPVPQVPRSLPMEKTPAIGYEAPTYKPYEPFKIETPEKIDVDTRNVELPIEYRTEMPASRGIKDRVIDKEFLPFKDWNQMRDARIGLNTGRFGLSATGKFQREWTDKNIVLKELTDFMSGGGKISGDFDLTKHIALKTDKISGRLKIRNKDLVRLKDEVEAAGIDIEDLSDYVYAKHEPEFRQREIDNIRAEMEARGAVEDADMVDDIMISNDPRISEAESLIKKAQETEVRLANKYADKPLDELAQKQFNLIDKTYNEGLIKGSITADEYIRVKGLADDTNLAPGSPLWNRIEESASSDALNPTRVDFAANEIDPLKKSFENYVPFKRIGADEESKAINALRYKDTSSVQGTPTQKIKNNVSTRELPNVFAQQSLFAQEQLSRQEDANIAQIASNMFSHKSGALFEIAEPITKQEAYTLDLKGDNILRAIVDGKEKLYKIKNKDVADALFDVDPELVTNLDKSLMSFTQAMEKGIKPATRTLSKYYTRLPSFFARNSIRDTQQAIINLTADMGGAKRTKGNYAKDFAKGVKNIFQAEMGVSNLKTKEIDELTAMGVFTDFYQFKTARQAQEAFNKQIKKGKVDNVTLTKVFDSLAATSENSTRYSIYKSAIDRGASKLEAAYFAKEASLNFSKKGRGTVPRLMRALYAFSNPMLLDVERGLKTVKSPEAMSKLALMYMAPAGAIFEWNEAVGGPDWRDGYGQDTLNNNWVIKMPEGMGVDLKIPKPYFINSILAMQDAADAVSSGARGGAEMTENAINTTMTNLIPILGDRIGNTKQMTLSNFTPTALSGVAQVMQNKNYFGGPIYPDYIENKQDQMWSKTKEGLFPVIEQLIPGEQSPEVIKHLIRSYAPGGIDVVDFISMFEEVAQIEKQGGFKSVAQRAAVLPVTKKFASKQEPWRRISDEIYKNQEGAGQGEDVLDEVKDLSSRLTKMKDYIPEDKYRQLQLANKRTVTEFKKYAKDSKTKEREGTKSAEDVIMSGLKNFF